MNKPERQSDGAKATGPRPVRDDAPPVISIELKINSHPANLRQVRKQLELFAHGTGMSEQACDEVGLVVNEALANVMRHGYEGATDKPIVVTAEAKSGELRVSIRDWAKPFDPAKVAPKSECELSPGGLGLLCMRKIMDDVQFQQLADGMLLTMVKRIAS